MNTAPERAKGDTSDKPMLTRMEILKAGSRGYEPGMPVIDAGYLIEHLFDAGPVMSGGVGASAVTHEELRAYQFNIGIELQPWEVRFIRRLSRDYVNELRKAEKADCPAPWNDEHVQEKFNSLRMRDSIRAMARKE